MFNFGKLYLRNSVFSNVLLRQETKRYAGHAKWQNIKHIKAEKDMERSAIVSQFVRKMRVAIAEGKSYKPLDNPRLAQIIEDAKKKCVPSATIANVLEKAEKSKTKGHADYVDFRGPGGSIFVIKVVTDNTVAFRMILHTVFKKTSCQAGDPKMRNIFDHRGIILTETLKDLDGATDDAISVGAEEVEEIEDDTKYNRFICDPNSIPKVANKLKALNYNIISTDEEFIPKVTIEISEEDSKKIDNLYKRLSQFDEIVSINHNIHYDKDEEKEKPKD